MTNHTGSLDPLFEPRTVAVVGVSRDERKKGSVVLRNLLNGYSGQIFPVHPTADNVAGLTAYSSLDGIPTEIDLLIPLIPADNLMGLVRDCPAGLVKMLLAVPSGFGEVPATGGLMERELVELAHSKGMRVVGPNTLGIMNCGFGLNASMAPNLPQSSRGFSTVTQSGGFGMAVYMYAMDHQLDVAKLCDLGNTSDISIAEVLANYIDDPNTTIIGAFLESNPDRIAATIGDASREKPLVLTAIGRTDAGRRAAFAHLGPAPGQYRTVPSPDSPVIVARTGLELLDIVKAMTWQPPSPGPRIGILTGSGGIGTELVDLCVEHGLEVPEFSASLQKRLRPHLPSYASVLNPVDLTPAWPDYPEMYPPLMEALLDSDELDLLIITVIDMATALPDLMQAVTSAVQTHMTNNNRPTPVLALWVAPPGFTHHRQMLQTAGVPCYSSTLSTVRVAAAMSQHGRHTSGASA